MFASAAGRFAQHKHENMVANTALKAGIHSGLLQCMLVDGGRPARLAELVNLAASASVTCAQESAAPVDHIYRPSRGDTHVKVPCIRHGFQIENTGGSLGVHSPPVKIWANKTKTICAARCRQTEAGAVE